MQLALNSMGTKDVSSGNGLVNEDQILISEKCIKISSMYNIDPFNIEISSSF